MPELPEVETIRRDLNKLLKRRKIIGVEAIKPKIAKHNSSKKMTDLFAGARFVAARRFAKYLVLDWDNGWSLLAHFKLSGSILYVRENVALKYAYVIFHLDNDHKVCFCEPRTLGFIEPVKTASITEIPALKKLGIEPLTKDFAFAKFKALLDRKTKIKPLLMDQTIFSGIGNIYACEALFIAGIRPDRPANTIKEAVAKKLYSAVNKVIKAAIEHRGSSVDDYVDASGRQGDNVRFLKVYNREGEKCFRCKGTVKWEKLGGRGTYWCPKCQK